MVHIDKLKKIESVREKIKIVFKLIRVFLFLNPCFDSFIPIRI